MTLAQPLARGLAELGLQLSPAASEKLIDYLALVQKWNRVYNLTAVRDPRKMLAHHLLDCLAIVPGVSGTSLLDVGSGAGFPGIPLSIALPRIHVTLLDSSHKKAAFLQQAKTELGLANIEVVCERVEQWHPGRTFDAVVSRAFSELAEFVQQAKHLVAPGGRMLAMKGVHPFEEIARLPATHRVASVVELSVPQLDAKRHLVLLEAA